MHNDIGPFDLILVAACLRNLDTLDLGPDHEDSVRARAHSFTIRRTIISKKVFLAGQEFR